MQRQMIVAFTLQLALTSFNYPLPVQATENSPLAILDLQGLLSTLVHTNDRVLAFSAKRQAAVAQVRGSQAGFRPTVDLTADSGYQRYDRQIGSLTRNWRYQFGLQVNQLITDFGLTKHTIQRAKAALNRAVADEKKVLQEVLFEGVAAYLRVIRARNRLRYAKISVASIRKQAAMEERLRIKGAGLASDVLQSRAQLAGSLAAAANIQGEMAAALHRFEKVFYLRPDQQAVSAMVIPLGRQVDLPDSAEEAVKVAMQQNPRITSAAFRVVMAKQDIAQNQARMRPKFVGFAQAQQLVDDAGIPGFQNNLSIGVRFIGNLYRGGADAAAIERASRKLEAVQSREEFVRHQVAEETRQAWSAQKTASRVLDALRQQVQDLEEFLRLARRERKLGTRSLLDVLSGEITAMNARSALAAARIDQQIQRYRLITSMGGMSPQLFASSQGN